MPSISTWSRAGAAARQLTVPLDVRPRVWYNEDLDSRNYIIPGLIAVIMMVISAMLTSLTVAREWERGAMEQLISTPLKVSELILGKLTPYFAVGAFGVVLAMTMGEFLFHVPLRGNVALLLGTSAVFLVGSLGMGILISIVTKNQLLANQLAGVTTLLPAFLLSGFIYNIANMPQAIRAVTYLVRAVFRGDSERNLPEGRGLREILAGQIVLLVIFAAAMLLLAHCTFHKRLESDVRAHPTHADQGVHPGLSRPPDADRDLRDPLRAGAGDRLRRDLRRETRADGRLRSRQQPGEPRTDDAVRPFGLFRRGGGRRRRSERRDALDRGEVTVLVRFNHGFAESLRSGRTAGLQILVDGTDSNTARIALNYAVKIATAYSNQILAKRVDPRVGPAGRIGGIETHSRAWFNENVESRNFFVPGVLVMVVAMTTQL